MPTCALINIAAGVVENIIIAVANDPVDSGYLLIQDPPQFVTIGIKWDGAQFIKPPPPPNAKPSSPPGLTTL